MSNTPETETPSRPAKPRSSRNHLAVLVSVSLLAVAGGLLWYTWDRLTKVEDRLAQAEREGRQLGEELEASRRRVDETLQLAEDQKSRAEHAEQEAKQTAQARRQAELEREFAREQSERASAETRQAQQDAERSRAETQQLRKRREDELDRMQDALSRIAETNRTPMGMVVNLGEDSFLFDFDKATLRSENREILSRIAGVLLASYGYRLYVYGHTDSAGPNSYNLELSERRAEAVKGYLVDAGISTELVDVRGFGEKSPTRANATSAGRRKNRRVEIGVIDTVISYQGQVKR